MELGISSMWSERHPIHAKDNSLRLFGNRSGNGEIPQSLRSFGMTREEIFPPSRMQ